MGREHIVSWFMEREPIMTKFLLKQENNEEDNPIELGKSMRRNEYNVCVKLVTGIDMSKQTDQDLMMQRIENARSHMKVKLHTVVNIEEGHSL